MARAVKSNFQVDYHERHDLTGSISIGAKKNFPLTYGFTTAGSQPVGSEAIYAGPRLLEKTRGIVCNRDENSSNRQLTGFYFVSFAIPYFILFMVVYPRLFVCTRTQQG